MVTTLAFDTLMYAKKLREAGVPEKQTEVQAEAMAEIIEDKLATKDGLISAKTEIEYKFEVRLAETKTELIKWMLGTSITQAAVIIFCIKLIH